jgi:Mg-chelatase subunit ChlD
VPNFIEKEAITDDMTVTEEERPDPQDLPSYTEGSNLFIFIVDRSGSMSGSKMETTKEALVLFLKSLPMGSKFEIINFGTKFDRMSK